MIPRRPGWAGAAVFLFLWISTGAVAQTEAPADSSPFARLIASADTGDAADLWTDLPALKDRGVTALSTRVRWRNIEPEPGVFDWSATDALLDALVAHELSWMPVLDFGSADAQPTWLREQLLVDSGEVLSATAAMVAVPLWNPRLPARVDRLFKAFAEHYSYVPEIETLILGLGEDGSPRVSWPETDASATHAAESLQNFLKQKHERLMTVNDRWGTNHNLWEEVSPGLLEDEATETRRRDELDWVNETVRDWVDFCVTRARSALPRVAVAIQLVDYAPSSENAILSELVETVEKNRGAIVISSHAETFPQLFAHTDHAITSARRAEVDWALRLPEDLPGDAITDWLYLAASQGASRIVAPAKLILSETWDTWESEAETVPDRSPERSVAVFYPDPALRLTDSNFFERAAALRDITDFDILDENQIGNSALRDYRALIFLDARRIDRMALRHIYAWIKDGGVLYYPRNAGLFVDDADSEGYYEVLFNPELRADPADDANRPAGMPALVSDATVTHEQAARLLGEVSRRLGTGWTFLVPEKEDVVAGPMYRDFIRLLLLGHVRFANFKPLDNPGDESAHLYWTQYPYGNWLYYNNSDAGQSVIVYPRGTARRVNIPAGKIVSFNPASF